jgi:DNA-binding GntR family transcriptional regulator
VSAKWEQAHAIFHQSLMVHAGPVILESIENCWSRSERARRAYMRTAPQSWLDSEDEHIAIVEAYAAGDVDQAVYLTTRQLTRIARIVIGNIDPVYEPIAIRQALMFTSGAASQPSDAKPKKNSRKPNPVLKNPA